MTLPLKANARAGRFAPIIWLQPNQKRMQQSGDWIHYPASGGYFVL
jgi:hypothetical protein